MAEQELTAGLASYVCELQFAHLPADVVAMAKDVFLDAIGGQLACSTLPLCRMAIDYARQQAGPADATVLGTEFRTGVEHAALVNGILGHGDEIVSRRRRRWPAVRELASRVTVEASEELQARFPDRIGAVVTVTTPDGSFVRQQNSPIGSPDEPMSEGQVAEKFRQLSCTVLDMSDSESLWKEIMSTPFDDPAYPFVGKLAATPDTIRSAS